MYDFARYLNIRSALAPVLSPDGTRVAFLSDISGNFQVWSVSTEPGQPAWPEQLTYFADKVWALHGTPAAPHLLAVGDVGGNELQQFYLLSGYGDEKQGHEVRRLTHDDQAIHRFGAWSGDGQQLVYTCNARNKVDFDVYLLDLASGDSRLLYQAEGNRMIEAWSPEGRFILMIDGVGSLQDELYLLDLQTGQEHHLTAGRPPARYQQFRWRGQALYGLSDRPDGRLAVVRLELATGEVEPVQSSEAHDGPGEIELLAIDPAGGRAAYTYNGDGYSRLYLLDLGQGAAQALAGLPAGVISSLRFSPDGRRLVLDLQAPDRNPDIWLVELAGDERRPLTASSQAGIAQASFGLPQLIYYRSFDDLEIPALYFQPRQAAPEGGYPCLFYVHGGPTDQIRPAFDVRFQYFLNQGYAILAPNVRGSSGYGRVYAALDEVEKRMDSVVDLEYAMAWLHGRVEINPRRVAIYGRSYGGFMVLAALTEYPDLFAAGVDVVGISNWVTFLERTSAWRRGHREQEYGSLAQHRALLERISPIHRAERIKVPLLVQAGDNDPRVPLSESEQIVERVRAAGGVVEFVHYADEGHQFSKLANRIDSFSQMAEFLARYV
jgi:dipeptidyl aminopeptidase/acylaminoacyl peptidase